MAVELYNGDSFCDEVVQSQDIDLINLQHRILGVRLDLGHRPVRWNTLRSNGIEYEEPR